MRRSPVRFSVPHFQQSQQSNDFLLEVYAASCAPITDESVIDSLPNLHPDELTLEIASQEYKFAKKLSSVGFKAFGKAFGEIESDHLLHEPVVVSTVLISASAFAKRLSRLADNLSVLCAAAAEKVSADCGELSTFVEELKNRAKEEASSPDVFQNSKLHQCLSLNTPVKDWTNLEVPLKNRVGFKTTTAVISEGKVKEEALKVAEFQRRKQRNPTGYHKFNFKELTVPTEDSSDFESLGRRSTDGGSTRGSFSGTRGGASTSRSASSGEDLDELDGKHDETPPELKHRGSSVVFDKEREIIEDEEADPEWEEKQRHQRRFSRIRNRVPTGHPSLTRGSSDVIADLVKTYETWLSNEALDTAVVENTEANKNI